MFTLSSLPRAFLIILDGVGVGGAADADKYGDEGSDTLGNLARDLGGLNLPNLKSLGLGNLAEIQGISQVTDPLAYYGRMIEKSAGKDSVTGHWEICGLVTNTPFPVFEKAFPEIVVEKLKNISSLPVIGNEVASGTEIISRLGSDHVATKGLILYTSADSVLQIAAHEEIVPLEEQYRICHDIREWCNKNPEFRVGRVIARPFVGTDGNFVRTPNRKDYAVQPHGETILDIMTKNNIPVQGIGKVDTLFDGRGFSAKHKTAGNAEGMETISELIRSDKNGFIFANLIDFDMLWGHRNDKAGFNAGLEALDEIIPEWLNIARPDDLFVITADHGNDPTTPSTDHSRENVPLLAWKGKGGNGKSLGTREGFYDVAATFADHFGLEWSGPGKSFYSLLTS